MTTGQVAVGHRDGVPLLEVRGEHDLSDEAQRPPRAGPGEPALLGRAVRSAAAEPAI